jgi:predicted XRE-type DNA-binding protein
MAEPPAEATNLKLRSSALMAIRQRVESWKVTQDAAARRLGMTRPRLNALMNGKLSVFSLDALVNIATKAGLKLELKFRLGGDKVYTATVEEKFSGVSREAREMLVSGKIGKAASSNTLVDTRTSKKPARGKVARVSSRVEKARDPCGTSVIHRPLTVALAPPSRGSDLPIERSLRPLTEATEMRASPRAPRRHALHLGHP